MSTKQKPTDDTSDDTVERGEQAGRLPSLEAQTPGLDTAQEHRTEADAHAYFEGGAGQGEGATPGTAPVESGQAEGVREGQPPAGDVRAAYSVDRAPGAAEPQGGRS